MPFLFLGTSFLILSVHRDLVIAKIPLELNENPGEAKMKVKDLPVCYGILYRRF